MRDLKIRGGCNARRYRLLAALLRLIRLMASLGSDSQTGSADSQPAQLTGRVRSAGQGVVGGDDWTDADRLTREPTELRPRHPLAAPPRPRRPLSPEARCEPPLPDS